MKMFGPEATWLEVEGYLDDGGQAVVVEGEDVIHVCDRDFVRLENFLRDTLGSREVYRLVPSGWAMGSGSLRVTGPAAWRLLDAILKGSPVIQEKNLTCSS